MSSRQNKPTRKPSASAARPQAIRFEGRNDAPPPTKKIKTKPLMSLAKPPRFDLSGIQASNPAKDTKGKGKEKAGPSHERVLAEDADASLWVDIYEPSSEAELAVHKRKVQEVRQWLVEALDGGPSGKLKKYRRILVLTGPAGTAKTATVRVLSAELEYDILEWRNTMDERFLRAEDGWEGVAYEGLSEKFRTFIQRASSCRSIFAISSSGPNDSQSTQGSLSSRAPPSTAASSASTPTSSSSSPKRRVILIEDLPNILHQPTQEAFHSALEGFVASQENDITPIILIISDTGLRGEDGDGNGSRWRPRAKDIIDVRNALSPALLSSPAVRQISFNPIAVTFMRAALKGLLDQHFSRPRAAGARPTKEVLDLIVESSNGDIRSAIMALQFACTAEKPTQTGKKGAKSKGPSGSTMVEAITRREQSLALFHLLGKIMYNKRKGDPPAPSASAKDIRRDQDIDSRLKDPRPLPPHLSEHERKPSRVDVETLYADSPIDASLLSLYIHQNYTQYCNTLDECDALADVLSAIDASGGEHWYQANPHQFHLVTLGTLHALPTPVPRRGQKPFKPAFFESLRLQHGAEDATRDVQGWLQRIGTSPVSAWTQRDVALETGAILRCRSTLGNFHERVPPSHTTFSRLEFSRNVGGLLELGENEDEGDDAIAVEPEDRPRPVLTDTPTDMPTGASLSDDEIEDW